ncbi:MAG: class I SAM-dependent methyltransferase [Planctomycetes bacterium]|nr:class I SAM-dependent methyltransferase [Planctomycetota bacterium]
MDYQLFVEGLPELYLDWGLPTARPKAPQFGSVLEKVQGMTSPGVLQLLNRAVDFLGPGELYAEVGSFQGATLIGALLGHPEKLAWAVDNSAEFDPAGQNFARLQQNLADFGLGSQVVFHNMDLEEFFLTGPAGPGKIGAYFLDGPHDYRSQLLGLLLARPFLAEQALMVVDDYNWGMVRQSVWDFLAVQPEARLLGEWPTPGNCHPSFWNGVAVLAWDGRQRNNYTWPDFHRARQKPFLESLYLLQQFQLRREGNTIRIKRTQ